MNHNKTLRIISWLLLSALLATGWYGATQVRQARSLESVSGLSGDSSGLYPVWVISVLETLNDDVIEITEFIFPTYDACFLTSQLVKQQFNLQTAPACRLIWLDRNASTPELHETF